MSVDRDLRAAAHADVPAIMALIDASVRGLSVGIYTNQQIDESLESLFGVDSQLIADGTYFVIESEGQLVASGGWSRRRTLYGGDQAKAAVDALLNPAIDAARIRAFFVRPSWARRGLARQLYERCAREATLAGFQRFQLGATLPGVPLYVALGFRAVQDIDFRMPSGAALPIVQMEREILTDSEHHHAVTS